MKIYDESTKEELFSPDLKNGYLYDGTKIVGQTIQVMDGTISEFNPEGLNHLVDIIEDCQFYHSYTDDEKQEIYNNKITQLSNSCNDFITRGLSITLSDGETKEFSYSIEDQSNISEMFNAILLGATSYPYHANGEACKMYSAQDIITIYFSLSQLKTSQITYFNQLKQYLLTLKDVSDIQSIEYGQALKDEYLENYNTLITQAKEQMMLIISKVNANAS